MGTSKPLRRLGNLPEDVTSFVGRRQETAEIKRLFTAARLVTLTGPGGVGKSRLAVHCAQALRRAFPDGAWLVKLGTLRESMLVDHAVVAALEVRDQSTRTAETAVQEYLADKQMLLVVDNCEHVLDRCGPLIHSLLTAAPGVSVLATSRAPLGVPGEHTMPVAPLPAPDERQPDSLLGLLRDRDRRIEALKLFETRAAAVRAGFSLDERNVVTVARVCQRLDGLPLAIELAAARVRVMTVGQILERLADRYVLLTSGNRTAPARHRTLRAAVEWSFGLCSARERALWARLSVFDGTFDMAAAESVAGEAGEVFDGVAGLIDKSIVLREPGGGPARYRLLETIREYGRARLRDSGETPTRRRHQRYYLDLAEHAEREWNGPGQYEVSVRLQQERTNLWQALDWSLAHPGSEHAALHFVGALWPYWVACGFLGEGRAWANRALAADRDPSPQRARALWVAGWVAVMRGELSLATALLDECRDLARLIGEPGALACATQFRGAAELCSGNPHRAVGLLEEAVAGHRAAGVPGSVTTIGLTWLAFAEYSAGNLDRAKELCEECRAACAATREEWALSWVLALRGFLAWTEHEEAPALADVRRSLVVKRSLNDLGVPFCVDILVWLAMSQGDTTRAARLMGVSDTLWRPIGTRWFGFQSMIDLTERHAAQAKAELGAQAFRAAYGAGRHLGPAEALCYALDEPDGASVLAPTVEPSASGLTRREREVAQLVARGLSNREIAAGLVISQRTAETHIEHILAKMGFNSRTQIAAWVSNGQPG